MPIEIFFSYAHEDEPLRDQLANHLKALADVVVTWHDRNIGAGTEWAEQIDARLNSADIILLLISADFIASRYCTDVEVPRALARHAAKEARVIPVILRPCAWTGTSYGKLQALPKDGKAIIIWQHPDEAFHDVVNGVSAAVAEIEAARAHPQPPTGAQIENVKPQAQVAAGTNIPRLPAIGFVPRSDKQGDIVAQLTVVLAPDQQVLIALSGDGGRGKTVLAIETATKLSAAFKRRVVWVSALGREKFALTTLLDEVATQLGTPGLRTLAPEPKEEQVGALVAQAPTLIVLDNFETVAADEQARCINFLAQRTKCPALITTRQKIASDLVRNVAINTMLLPEARELVRRLIEQAQDPGIFAGLDHDRIIKAAESNPFVIQWVIGQIDLAQEPEEVLTDITAGAGEVDQRVFSRSFNLPQLSDDGRAILLALSLFTPSAARDALAHVAGFDADVPRFNTAVKRLSALWLIKTTDTNKRLALEGLTRQFAQTRLRQDAHADDYRRRFIAHFLTYAQAHKQETAEAYDALEAELDNLLAAMDAAEELHDWQSVRRFARVLARPVSGVLGVRGHWDEAIRRGEQGARAAAVGDEGEAVKLAGDAATIRMLRGEYAAARAAYERALAVLRPRGDERNVAVFLHLLGMVASDQGEYAEARRLYDESLVITKKLNDQRLIAMMLQALGWLAQAQGERVEAQRLFNESLVIKKTLNDQRGIAITLHHLAMLAEDEGERVAARRLYLESLAIKQTLGNQRGIALTLRNLGLLAEQEGNRAEAAQLIREALRIFERLGLPGAERARQDLARLEGAGE